MFGSLLQNIIEVLDLPELPYCGSITHWANNVEYIPGGGLSMLTYSIRSIAFLFCSFALLTAAKAEREFWYNGEPCYLGTNPSGDNVDPNMVFENEEERIRRGREREQEEPADGVEPGPIDYVKICDAYGSPWDFSLTGAVGGTFNTGSADLQFATQYFNLDNANFPVLGISAEYSHRLTDRTRFLLRAQYNRFNLDTTSVVNRVGGAVGAAAGDATVSFIGAGAGIKTWLGPGFLGGVVLAGNAHSEISLPSFNITDNALALHFEVFYQLIITEHISIVPSISWTMSPDGSGNPGMPDMGAIMVGGRITF